MTIATATEVQNNFRKYLSKEVFLSSQTLS